jgi:hypothetical protein
VAAAADDLAALVINLRSRAPQPDRVPVAYAGSLLAQAPFRAKVTAALMAAGGVEVRDGVVEPLDGVPRLVR